MPEVTAPLEPRCTAAAVGKYRLPLSVNTITPEPSGLTPIAGKIVLWPVAATYPWWSMDAETPVAPLALGLTTK